MVRDDIQITMDEFNDCLKRHNLNEREVRNICVKHNTPLIKNICELCGAINLYPIDKKCSYCGEKI